jgi:hypothetical protein
VGNSLVYTGIALFVLFDIALLVWFFRRASQRLSNDADRYRQNDGDP